MKVRYFLFTLGLVVPALAADWTVLFNGKSLDGWYWDKTGETSVPSWEVGNGALCTTPGKGKKVYLITREEWEDFELRFEWKTETGGNSGVKYRIQNWWDNERRLEPTGLEYQMTDDVSNRDALSDIKHSSGAIYDYVAPKKKEPARPNVWHRAGIVVKGTKVEHWLNEEKVVDIDLSTPDALEQFATSPRESREMLRKQERRKSPLALQIHDGVVCFRELKIKPL